MLTIRCNHRNDEETRNKPGPHHVTFDKVRMQSGKICIRIMLNEFIIIYIHVVDVFL